MGENPDTLDSLIEELKKGKWKAERPTGMPDVPAVRILWGGPRYLREEKQ
jgi:hypothetical protein